MCRNQVISQSVSKSGCVCMGDLKMESTKLTLKCVCHTKVSIISNNNNNNNKSIDVSPLGCWLLSQLLMNFACPLIQMRFYLTHCCCCCKTLQTTSKQQKYSEKCFCFSVVEESTEVGNFWCHNIRVRLHVIWFNICMYCQGALSAFALNTSNKRSVAAWRWQCI